MKFYAMKLFKMKYNEIKYFSIQINIYSNLNSSKKGYVYIFIHLLGFNLLVNFSHKGLKKRQIKIN